MATTNLNVRVDENIKKNAEELLEDLGMNLSTAINVFLRQLIRANGFPCPILAAYIVLPQSDLPIFNSLSLLSAASPRKILH